MLDVQGTDIAVKHTMYLYHWKFYVCFITSPQSVHSIRVISYAVDLMHEQTLLG